MHTDPISASSKILLVSTSSVQDAWAAVGSLEPPVGDRTVGGLCEVDAVPDEVVLGVGAGAGPGHATPRLVVVVVLALPAGSAAHLQPVLQSCKLQSN